MIEALIKKIEDCDNEIVLEVRIKIPEKPICPDQGEPEFDKEEKYINAEVKYQKQLVEWKALLNDIQFLRLGDIELKQYNNRRE
jgi:hypothetical protein